MRHLRAATQQGMAFFLLMVMGLATGPNTATAQPQQVTYAIAPVPAWVADTEVDYAATPPDEQVSDGVYYLLLDRQVEVGEGTQAFYLRLAVKVLNEQGISEVSQLSFDFDPSYEALTIHTLQVRRNADVNDHLQRDNITLLQREEELEYQIYDGTQTASVILEDVRVGDVVEYSFTVSGANPVFDGMYSGSVSTEWSVPVHRFRHRLLWPAHRTLHLKNHGTTLQPTQTEMGDMVEYIWAAESLRAKVGDGQVPSWYDTYAWVQLSEWATWNEVVEWGLPLYAPVASPSIRREAEAIMQTEAEPAARLIAALRFVQDDVRYMGIEMGRGSHEPRLPDVVLQQRFGDCKDKTRLLITLLREMDIAAWPALVDTDLEHVAADRHPTPLAFDHVITAVDLAGERVWVDPTNLHQRGALEYFAEPDYGKALVLKPGTTGFTDMRPLPEGRFGREILETFDLRSGVGEDALYTVRTIFYGANADNFRYRLSWQSREELAKSYINYYASSYPTIEEHAPLEIHDDEELNRIIVTESYHIAEAWLRPEEAAMSAFEIYPYEMRAVFDKPNTPLRTMPLYIGHPTRLEHTMNVILPESWTVDAETQQVDDAAFAYTMERRYQNEVLTVTHTYETLTDHLRPDQVADHIKNIDKVIDNMGYQIYQYDDGAGPSSFAAINWPMLMLALLVLGMASYFSVRLYHYDPATLPLAPEARDPKLTGIDGWLIVFAIRLVVGVLITFVSVIQSLEVTSAETWHLLTRPGTDAYHSLWAPALTFELAFHAAALAFDFLMLVLFFKRRQSFPKVYILYLWIYFAGSMLDLGLAMNIPAAVAEGIGMLDVVQEGVAAGICTLYLLYSKRVACTFVERRQSSPPPIPVVPPPVSVGVTEP